METLDINNRRYLGSKSKLIGFIKDIVDDNCKDWKSFLDVFAGTGVVASTFNSEEKDIYINDILLSNYYSYSTWFGNEKVDLSKIDNIIEEYNNIDIKEDNYFSSNFGGMYFSYNDSKKIGYIREDIEKKYIDGYLSEREKNILVTALIYSADRVANTVGHYDAYRKNIPLKDKFKVHKLQIGDTNINRGNKIFNMDSNELVRNIKTDIVYIDPPYNSRQYSDAYHLLENLAEWKKPKVFGVAKKMDRTKLKSNYCTQKAVKTFKDLIDNIDSKYILVSYNNMGLKGAGRSQARISDKELLEVLEKKGKTLIFETEYNYFTTGKTNIDDHKERIFFCEVDKSYKYPKNNCDSNVFLAAENEKFDNYVKSPINYTGGKYKLLNQILPQLPENIETFVDVFCGGYNVGSNVCSKKTIAIDNNNQLIRLLKLFRNKKHFEIISKIEEIIEEYSLSDSFEYGYKHYTTDSDKGLGIYNKEKFMKLRADYNKLNGSSEMKDYILLVLIIYSFNNQIRFNSKNEFNSPVR